MHFGVTQASVLKPKNYCMYTKPADEIMKWHNIKYHYYADDTKVYMNLNPCEQNGIIFHP